MGIRRLPACRGIRLSLVALCWVNEALQFASLIPPPPSRGRWDVDKGLDRPYAAMV